MRFTKTLGAVFALLLLAACGDDHFVSPKTEPPVDVTQLPPMRVASFTVTVPETLSVSEDNTYDPSEKIVWRGDPFGPRHPQVKAVVETGIAAGIKDLNGKVPVILDIVVQRFHSQTEKIRYSFGGKYEVEYDLQVRDARSGAVIIPAYRVYAEVDAPGGADALAADHEGRTQKDDNIKLIAESIRTQLTGIAPDGTAVAEG